jgi:hypothetical protein
MMNVRLLVGIHFHLPIPEHHLSFMNDVLGCDFDGVGWNIIHE